MNNWCWMVLGSGTTKNGKSVNIHNKNELEITRLVQDNNPILPGISF